MKKIVIIATVALFGVVVLPSCKKDYTCTCSAASVGQSRTNLPNSTKSDAKAACDKQNADFAKFGGSCTLD